MINKHIYRIENRGEMGFFGFWFRPMILSMLGMTGEETLPTIIDLLFVIYNLRELP